MQPDAPRRWDRLFDLASDQAGLFTTEQAAALGFSSQLLAHHLSGGRIARALRGVYRVVHFPRSDDEQRTAVWLWSGRTGVFSHETALGLHQLSDVLPSTLTLTLPASWRRRRLRVPDGVALAFADVADADRAWSGPVPVTTVRRTLEDCARAHFAPDLLRQATQQAVRRGQVGADELGAVDVALAPFGGWR